MNSALVRAEALRSLIDSKIGVASHPVPESVLSCATELIDAGEARTALDLLDTATTRISRGGSEWDLRKETIRARALRMLGRPEESLALARQLLADHSELLRLMRDEQMELRIHEAAALTQLNRVAESAAKLVAIRSELLALPDSSLLAWCTYHAATAETFRGEHQKARALALEAIVSARRCGNRFIEALALDALGRLERALCRWASAEEASTESLALFETAGNQGYASVSKRCLAILAWKRGRLDRALVVAEESQQDAAKLKNDVLEGYAHLLKCAVHLHAGRFSNALTCLDSVGGLGHYNSDSRPSLLAAEYRGDVYLERAEAGRALVVYEEVWPEALALVPKGDIVAELRRRRAECYLLLGRPREAYDDAKTGLDHCRELGDRYEEAATYRVLALAAAALGNPAEAKRWFDQGFAYYDDIETPYEWGKLWMSYGDWLSGSDAGEFADVPGAREAYLAARDHFERMGAEARLAEARARLSRMTIAAPATTAGAAAEAERPRRRPRGSAEMDRRSAWARETYGLVTRNKMVLDLLADVAKLAGAGSPMLILGESGTGKELVAQGVHRLSRRAGPFMPINCATLPRDVIESELFGHVQGSFTGAHRDKPGLLEACDGGTVFLDEIAEMSIELQSRLLRFLETGEIRRVGANRMLDVDTLIVAATNRERASLEKGEGFRPDLYYRLAHAVVILPPLRRRGDDVELLVGHFFEEACLEQEKSLSLSAEALRRLVSYPWPGNVRQLRAVLRRLAILAPQEHEIAGHEVHLDDADTASTLSEELEQAERRRMVEALAQTGGSRSDAARALGMARTTFVTKMKRYGIR